MGMLPLLFCLWQAMEREGYRTFCVFFNVNEASVYRALLAFIFSEKIFEGGMTRRDSRHCPQFLDSGNSSEFSITSRPAFHV